MSKRKKKGGKVQPDKLINLTTALLNLIVSLILLWERFKRPEVRILSLGPKTKGKKDLLLTKPVNPSLSRASTMKSGSPFLVDLLG
jgi:hypothetical protein